MSDNKNPSPSSDKVDEELSELLDSALEDFTKEDSSKKEPASDPPPTGTSSDAAVTTLPQDWTNDFIQQAASQFEENFANLLAGTDSDIQITPDLIQQKLRQMADAAQQVMENPAPVANNNASNDIAASISQAIQGLSAGAENLQAPLNEEDLMKMFGGAGGVGQENDLLPFMQGMMQGLLSKEVLGPSLEDFIQRLPEYIEKNKEKLSKEDVDRYTNQKKLMEDVLEELKKEKETDSAAQKTERFTKVLGLMQKLQDYGQPPVELVGDIDGPFNFDAQGNPLNLPGGPNQECSIM